jgi:hypothetical protein
MSRNGPKRPISPFRVFDFSYNTGQNLLPGIYLFKVQRERYILRFLLSSVPTTEMTDSYIIQSEDIASGCPGYMAPLEVKFSPNGKIFEEALFLSFKSEPFNVGDHVTFLFPDQTGKRQLYSIYLPEIDWNASPQSFITKLIDANENNSGKLSLEEQLRQERMRLFVEGISTYEWCDQVNNGFECMTFPLSGKIYYYKRNIHNSTDMNCMCMYEAQNGAAIDPHIAPNGTSVAYVINNDLYYQHVNGTNGQPPLVPPARLTHEADKEGISAGVADYVAQEEMHR